MLRKVDRHPLRHAAARGRLAARPGRGRRRRPLRGQVPRRRPGPEGAGGRGDRRRAGARGRSARAGDRAGRARRRSSAAPSPTRRSKSSSPAAPGSTAGSTSCRARWTTTRPALARSTAAQASEIVWFDAFTTNVDRTPRNPNLLVWHRQTWLIDHGAALYQHHSDRDLVARAREPFPLIADHVLLPLASTLRAADARLAAVFDRRRGRGGGRAGAGRVARPGADGGARSVPSTTCVRRLAAPRAFVDEAEAARGA